jgi:DNA-binding transcriptional LysR family regulator
MLETSHLRCFVTVAEELHFGRAAVRLNMTQPPLSRQIQLLERAMKCELFLRNSRSVQLTHAGATFLPEAKRILRLIENASSMALDVSAGRRGVARCGFTASAAYQFLPALVRSLRQRLPDVSLALREMVSRKQLEALDAGELDIGFLRAPIDLPGYEHRSILRERLVAAIPRDHAFASKPMITWQDFHRQDFLMYESQEGRHFHNLVANRLALEGAYPNFVQHLSQIHSILSLVRAGMGLAVVPASARMMEISDIEYKEFPEHQIQTSELLVVWHQENRNPLVPEIAEIACSREVLAPEVRLAYEAASLGWV